MRGVASIIIATLALIVVSVTPARALDVSSPPSEYYSDIFMTAFQLGPVDSMTLDAFELYNSTNLPLSVNGWKVQGLVDGGVACEVELSVGDAYIPPEGYVVFADPVVLQGANVTAFTQPCGDLAVALESLRLVSPQRNEETINGVQPSAWVRKGLTMTYRDEDDDFSDNFELISKRPEMAVYAGAWYLPPAETNLQISEIVPRAVDCSPSSVDLDCNDYIKLYNPTTEPVDLAQFRLRHGHRSQSTTASNAIALSGQLPAGSYATVSTRADGSPLSITDSGGWIWLEDLYGITYYESSIVPYESTPADRIGWAWAYDNEDGAWKWTSTTTPYNQPSRFTLPVVEAGSSISSDELKPCAADQFRNPETNRCKKLTRVTALKPCRPGQERNSETNRCRSTLSATSTLAPCAAGQYRNPATNRCRSLTSSASSLVPCDADERRNPETNRCRKLASASSELKPCDSGQERNPETNRCRKVAGTSVLSSSDFPIEPISDTGQAFAAWWALGGVLLLGAGYASWEWRHEIRRSLGRIMSRSKTIE